MVFDMKAVELRELTLEELKVRETELAEELARMRIQLAIKRLDNPLLIRFKKRELARIKTIINEKTREEGSSSREEGSSSREQAGELQGT
jgi:large subunit ribosomal protein L29